MHNLSRKLRPKSFDQVVGQDLVKSMLKNSLFLNRLFPVYLFAGQRGCGKTTMARIFAKALNCEQLVSFREAPQSQPIPCLTCSSCFSMEQGVHPDFVELDAASNTGVDNIRQIIETSAYQPVLGKYRVFLIDEAHMLSKSAFNAFLKNLEEPAESVVFILATTEFDKIPATVRSRSFLSLFPSLSPQILYDFLVKVCRDFAVDFEPQAIWFVVRQSQGCPRDALNLLEQLMFCNITISENLALQAFSCGSVSTVLDLCSELFMQKLPGSMRFYESCIKNKYAPVLIFETMQEAFVAVLNAKLGVVASLASIFYGLEKELEALATKISIERLSVLMTLFWENQRSFVQASQKDLFLEFLILKACDLQVSDINQNDSRSVEVSNVNSVIKTVPPKKEEQLSSTINKESIISAGFNGDKVAWDRFLLDDGLVQEKMLRATFSSATAVTALKESCVLEVTVPKLNLFVERLVMEAEALIAKTLPVYFLGLNKIRLKTNTVSETRSTVTRPIQKPTFSSSIDFKNIEKWPITNLLLKYFPGKLIVESLKK